MKASIQANGNYFPVETQSFASLTCPDFKFDSFDSVVREGIE